MTMSAYLSAGLSPRYFEPRKWFGSPFACPWLDAPGSVADSTLTDQLEQFRVPGSVQGRQVLRGPRRPHLYCMFEAHLARLNTSIVRRLRHQQVDEVVSEQIYPKFLVDHRGALATERLHAQRRLDAAQVQLDVPATLVQLGQLCLGCLARLEQRGHQDPSTDAQLPHGQCLGKGPILFATHPGGARLGLGPLHPMITLAQRLAAAKIGDARSVLLEQHVHPGGLQRRDQEVIAVQRIGQQQLSSREGVQQTTKQTQLAVSFAGVRSDRRLQHRPSGQADDAHQPRQRKTHPLGLAARLRIAGLIRWGVGHRDAGTVGQLHAPTVPVPAPVGTLGKQSGALARQPADHLQRQACSSMTVCPGAHAVHPQPLGQALPRPGIDRSLAGTILLERLLDEHRQNLSRRVQPLTMLGQQCLGHLQQLRACEQVEEIHRAGSIDPPADAISTLLRMESAITITQGCSLRGW